MKNNTSNSFEELKPNFKETYSKTDKKRRSFNKLRRLFKKKLKNAKSRS